MITVNTNDVQINYNNMPGT